MFANKETFFDFVNIKLVWFSYICGSASVGIRIPKSYIGSIIEL